MLPYITAGDFTGVLPTHLGIRIQVSSPAYKAVGIVRRLHVLSLELLNSVEVVEYEG